MTPSMIMLLLVVPLWAMGPVALAVSVRDRLNGERAKAEDTSAWGVALLAAGAVMVLASALVGVFA